MYGLLVMANKRYSKVAVVNECFPEGGYSIPSAFSSVETAEINSRAIRVLKDRHTDTQNDYCNPAAYVQRINKLRSNIIQGRTGVHCPILAKLSVI